MDTARSRRNILVKLLLKGSRKIRFLKEIVRLLDAASIWERLPHEYESQLRALLELCYYYCCFVDNRKLITQIGDSGLGAPNIIMTINGKKYTIHFLRYFLQYLYLTKFIDFQTLSGIVEIGGGYGGLAEVILKFNPHIIYVDIDIPPQTYIAQQYLDACFSGKVFGYTDVKRDIEILGDLRTQIHAGKQVFVLCPWQLPFLRGEYDLFVSSASFQEMEPEIVENYARYLKHLSMRYGYIRAMPEGTSVAKKPGEPGTLAPVTKDHYIRYFDTFKLVDERCAEILPRLPGTLDLYRDMFFIAQQVEERLSHEPTSR
jgi:putative sugar O-methyltransferase